MRPHMNKHGHAKTLVPAHPGNRNAVKAGVYSEATLAPRVHDLSAEIATRSPHDVVLERLRWEVAALAVLGQAMDQSLIEDGLLGRRGEPRTLVSTRLRLNERMGKTLDRYALAVEQATNAAESVAADEPVESLSKAIAAQHSRTSLELVGPRELDPEYFLTAIITAPERLVSIDDRLRARTLLTARIRRRSEACLCFSGLRAQDGLTFWQWIDELREAGLEPDEADEHLAGIVRRFAAGARPEPWAAYRRTEQAIRDVVEVELHRARGEPETVTKRFTGQNDPALTPFWAILLSADEEVTAKDRLKAFVALEKAGALLECTCAPEPARLTEDKRDIARAYFIRLVAGRHYRAAVARVRYPETYLALRDTVDAKLLAEAHESGKD
jgi:hypothetical protein